MKRLSSSSALTLTDWIEYTKSNHLTIQTISEMTPGETRKFLCLDRNVYDLASKSSTPLLPKDFFHANYFVTYTHDNDLYGTTTFEWDGEAQDTDPFEFEIEYNNDTWFPLKRGIVTQYSGDAWREGHPVDLKKVHWTEYPTTTRIGWRGPMIPTDCLETMPKVLYEDGEG